MSFSPREYLQHILAEAKFLVEQTRNRTRSDDLRDDAMPGKPLDNEGFVGIWSDREELAYSTEWVRRLRAES